jgi:hypothetical protein
MGKSIVTKHRTTRCVPNVDAATFTRSAIDVFGSRDDVELRRLRPS